MSPHPKHILVIDKQDYWRRLSVHALEQAGFSVSVLDNYDYQHWIDSGANQTPNLVILGCASIGPEEQSLISYILEHKHHLLVLSSTLPWRMMRSLFLLGVEDAADKPYDPQYLCDIVEGVLNGNPPIENHETIRKEAAT